MGSGDEGLQRTLAWGRREITGTIVASNTPPSLNFSNISKNGPQISQTAVSRLKALGYDTTKDFKEVVTDFQIDYRIITSRSDDAAGSYGPKTTAKLTEVYNNFLKKSSVNSAKTEAKTTERMATSAKMSETAARELAQNMKLPQMGRYGK